MTLRKILALVVSGLASRVPRTQVTRESARKGNILDFLDRQLLKNFSKIDELEKQVHELRDALDNNRPAPSISANSTINAREMHRAPMAPAAPISYPGPTIQTSSFNSPREVSTAGSVSHPPLSGTTSSITHESPLTVIESPFPASNRSSGESSGRPRALKVRALESTALGKEQIDVLFQM